MPKLENLSLERNELRLVRDLDVLASKKFGLPMLKELVLLGNPLQRSAAESDNEEGYRRDVLARFPELQILDMKPVSIVEQGFSKLFQGRGGKAKAGTDASAVPLRNFPVQMRAGFVDGDASSIVPDFLSKCVRAWRTSSPQILLRVRHGPWCAAPRLQRERAFLF